MSKITRTETKANGGVTKKELSEISELVKKWEKNALRTEPANKEKLVEAVKKLYKAVGLREPKVVVVSSPLVAALAYGVAAAWWYKRKNGATASHLVKAVTSAVKSAKTQAGRFSALQFAKFLAKEAANSSVCDAVLHETHSKVKTEVESALSLRTEVAVDVATNATTNATTFVAFDEVTDNAVKAAIRGEAQTEEIIEATREAITAATWAKKSALENAPEESENWLHQVAKQFLGDDFELGLLCAERWEKSRLQGNTSASWHSYVEALRSVLKLNLPCFKKYDLLEECALNGSYLLTHENFCVAVDFPEKVTADEQNKPHNEHGASHRWRDGFEAYYLHGVRFEKELYLKVVSRSLSRKEIFGIKDFEKRAQALKFSND